MIQSIVRSQGGTEERNVLLDGIVIPDVPEMATKDIDKQWIDSAAKLKSDLTQVIADLRDGNRLSCDLFVPNYWKAAIKLPAEQEEPMIELWHLAHDLGKSAFVIQHERWRVDQDGVPGMLYHCPT